MRQTMTNLAPNSLKSRGVSWSLPVCLSLSQLQRTLGEVRSLKFVLNVLLEEWKDSV